MRVRVFVDFWNFQLNWNQRAHPEKCDWPKLPNGLCNHMAQALQSAQLGTLSLEETRVYASYEPGRENSLKNWLKNFLDRQPGVRVFTVERHWKQRPVHCRSCGSIVEKCTNCDSFLGKAAEKTIDARIVTDLLSLAWEGAFDVALLLTSDRDFIPAVEKLQEKNFKVINATWRGHGHELATVCWASFELDALLSQLKR